MTLTRNYGSDPKTYGGRIYTYDFDGYNSLSDIAARIISDFKFDEKLKKGVNYAPNKSTTNNKK